MEKTELRELLRRRLSHVSVADVAAASVTIAERLMREIDWQRVSRACLYQPAVKWREIDLYTLMEWLQEYHSSIDITILPQMKNAIIPDESFDVILVPLLGYDSSCSRLGRGSGWYDRFLAGQPQTIKIGVALEVQQLDFVPVELHDIRLDKVISEQATYLRRD